MKNTFTLIELMIVIAIIAIIAAIAIPNLVEARKAGNEAAAIGTMRTIGSAQALFREGDRDQDGSIDYAQNLAELNSAGLIDSELGLPGVPGNASSKSGYVFVMGGQLFSFDAQCSPEPNQGGRDFFTDQSGIITFAPNTSDAVAASASTANFEADANSTSIGS